MSRRQTHEPHAHQFARAPLRARSTIRACSLLRALALASLLPAAACSARREPADTAGATQSPTATADAQSNQSAQSAPPPANSNAQASSPPASNPPTHSPPQPAEINEKMARVFKGAVELDPAHKSLALVGDFNGDGSEDIAFAVRPTAAGLEEINSEVSDWILVDPQKVSPPDPHRDPRQNPPPERPKAGPGDQLLAVIHGYGGDGWRNPAAQQTYILRNALGRDPKVESKQDASYRLNLRFRGDVIEEELSGAPGLIEWTGATYAWLDTRRH